MQDTLFLGWVRSFFSLTSHCSKRSEKNILTGLKEQSALFTTAAVFFQLFTGEVMHLL